MVVSELLRDFAKKLREFRLLKGNNGYICIM